MYIPFASGAAPPPYLFKDLDVRYCDAPEYSPFVSTAPSIMDLQLLTNAVGK